MRTDNLPVVRVSPDSRALIESVLKKGESIAWLNAQVQRAHNGLAAHTVDAKVRKVSSKPPLTTNPAKNLSSRLEAQVIWLHSKFRKIPSK